MWCDDNRMLQRSHNWDIKRWSSGCASVKASRDHRNFDETTLKRAKVSHKLCCMQQRFFNWEREREEGWSKKRMKARASFIHSLTFWKKMQSGRFNLSRFEEKWHFQRIRFIIYDNNRGLTTKRTSQVLRWKGVFEKRERERESKEECFWLKNETWRREAKTVNWCIN